VAGSNFSITQLILGIVISLLIILFNGLGVFSGFYSSSSLVTQKIQQDSYEFFYDIQENLNFLTNLTETRSQRDEFAEENIRLISENTKLIEQLNQYDLIEKQLQFANDYDFIPVRIIRYSERTSGEVWINKGKLDGLEADLPVVIENFAIGQIVEVSEKTSRVRLLISPESRVPVISADNETKGILKGNVQSGLVMDEILIAERIDEKERILTSGINSNFPFGLNVGNIRQIDSIQSEVTKRAIVNSEIEYSNLRDLFVIVEIK
jgi:rod shape-determining protein MreC